MAADAVLSRRAVGNLFMVGLPGTELDESTKDLIRNFHINNFIIFKRNVSGREQLRTLCEDLRRCCIEEGLGLPLISIDQEGGSVTRLPLPFVQFPDARTLAEGPDSESALYEYAVTCARELVEVGINMNLAPVLDVSLAGGGFFMERRSLGGDPRRVAELGTLVIETLQKAGVAACAKHFPGLGRAVIDPHYHLPRVDRKAEELRAVDLIPFQAAMTAGVAAIMTSHTIYTALDPLIPATLSKKIFTGLLREELGFEGLVITDDLEMGAIENDGRVAEAAVRAFLAGVDLLLICHDHVKVKLAVQALVQSFQEKDVSEARIRLSLERVNAVRKRFSAS